MIEPRILATSHAQILASRAIRLAWRRRFRNQPQAKADAISALDWLKENGLKFITDEPWMIPEIRAWLNPPPRPPNDPPPQ